MKNLSKIIFTVSLFLLPVFSFAENTDTAKQEDKTSSLIKRRAAPESLITSGHETVFTKVLRIVLLKGSIVVSSSIAAAETVRY